MARHYFLTSLQQFVLAYEFKYWIFYCANMLRSIITQSKKFIFPVYTQKHTFLTNSYSCPEVWNSRFTSPILSKVKLDEFYTLLDQNYTSKGVISAVDVDIYANSIRDGHHLQELKDLIYKLRLSADTGNTLESTHHATIRNFLDHGDMQDLVEIVKDPLNYGIFMDDFTANLALDKLLNCNDFDKAVIVASQVMLQEDYSNEITCSLSQYACYKYISMYVPPEPEPPATNTKIKVEEVKIRIKFLRNPYFDDHFDIKDPYLLAGKTLAWISEVNNGSLNLNLELLGWCVYKKYEKLVERSIQIAKLSDVKIYKEVIDLLQREKSKDEKAISAIDKCLSNLNSLKIAEDAFEDALKFNIENAINMRQTNDIKQLEEMINKWTKVREEKLIEQTERLNRVKRVKLLEEKQKELQKEEQKLWFFDNEEKIDLEIESKSHLNKANITRKQQAQESDENYIPPEITPKRR